MPTATAVQFKVRCKTCPRTVAPEDLHCEGICDFCVVQRIDKFDTGFCRDLKESKARSDGFGYTCFECGQKHLLKAYVHWDVGANTQALLCRPCSDKAYAKAAQYRGTQAGWLQKAQ